MSAVDPAAVAEEIESIVARLRESADPANAVLAQRLVHLVLTLHGAGLSRILELVRAEGSRNRGLLERLAGDPLVSSLCALHDLQPAPDPGLIQIRRPPHDRREGRPSAGEERCELCDAPLAGVHEHLVDVESRRLVCACPMCGAVGGRYRRIPSRYVHRPSMTIAPAQWEALGIPVGLAFLFVNSHLCRTVACYPGPAGATEALVAVEAWSALVATHGWVATLAPDVEALLVRRVEDAFSAHIVPIDACYELVGRVREAWTGMSGGSGVQAEIDAFFAAVLSRSAEEVPA